MDGNIGAEKVEAGAESQVNNLDIAVVGMAARFPGANNIDEFWDNLKHGVESIRFYGEDEVIESGIFPDMARDKDFVAAAGGIDHEFDFDAEFFDFNPREAEITDPQQRIALECAWEALEAAGYNPETFGRRVGVFAGISINTYLLFNLAANPQLLNSVGHFQVMTANDKDFLATRIAYKLNLKGPAMSVQTACSTSLVAVNLACQSLLNFQSDMVIAGGVSITPKGRLYKEGFIFSRDGHCRAFDEAAQGTVGGNGVGFVVLKRLQDALDDGDHIHAVIRGSSINNDGSLKVGYTAPSVTGQVEVILEAQAMSGVDPDSITYVEAHGTGTLLGDPIEIAALTQAFRTSTQRKQYCAIGSVKTNIGHLDTAAGISGLIKAILTVEKAQIPPSLHFQKANPKLKIEETPFFVNERLSDWRPQGQPRRAAVSSFGFGGTNAHTILEQAPARAARPGDGRRQLLLVSGRSEAALKENMRRLGQHLSRPDAPALADAAFTLQAGRKPFKHRAYLVADSAADAAQALQSGDAKRIRHCAARDGAPGDPVVFMFSGQGSQYQDMARELYQSEPVFRDALDECARLMDGELQRDLLSLLFSTHGGNPEENLLAQTRYTQPALFAVEYALATLWQSWGVRPQAMIGHSVGEYVAACLAGVFTLPDAARLICQRGRLIHAQPPGAMLSVPLAEREVVPLLSPEISLAAVNAPNLCVVSGSTAAVEALQAQLGARGVESRRLQVSHAFHSHMLENAAREFEGLFAGVRMSAPVIPYISNVSGDWITPEQAASPRYWAEHLRQAVRFSDGLRRLLERKPAVLLEVGPGQVLTTLARQHRDRLQGAVPVASMRHPLVEGSDVAQLLEAAGALWGQGVACDWSAFHGAARPLRVPLPTYAFQRKRYWIPPVYLSAGAQALPSLPALAAAEPQAPLQEHVRSQDHEAPRDALERQVAEVWEKMLGISGIGIHDDFFKLGGHSLLATQLVAEVRRATGTEVSIQGLFQAPTIAGLTGQIRELKQQNPGYEVKTIPVIARNADLPLTFHQQAVWSFEHSYPGSARFNGVINLHLNGELDLDAMHFAIDEILRRHEVLRTNYRMRRGKSSAVIRPARHLDVPAHDLSGLPPAGQRRRMLQIANAQLRQPFDLRKDIYIRPTLLKLSEREHMLVIVSHYVAVDGWTIGLVIQEFGAHYGAYRKPGSPRLPELSFQCVDYAAWEREQVSAEFVEAHLPYWEKQLGDVPAQQPVPIDHSRPLFPSLRGSTLHFSLGPDLTAAAKAFSQKHGYTVFMTFVAALDVLYNSQSGAEDIVIGTMIGDRESGTEAMVGSLVNLIALRNRLHRGQSFLEILDNVRSTATDGLAHQVPFELVVERLKRNMFRNPFFRTVFVLRSLPYTHTAAEGMDVDLVTLPLDRGVADMDLTLYLQEKNGSFYGYFEYSTVLFDHATIENLSWRFRHVLREVLGRPAEPVGRVLGLETVAAAASSAEQPAGETV